VGCNYLAQPLLDTSGRCSGLGGSRSLIVTAAQIGYAAGLILLLPLAISRTARAHHDARCDHRGRAHRRSHGAVGRPVHRRTGTIGLTSVMRSCWSLRATLAPSGAWPRRRLSDERPDTRILLGAPSPLVAQAAGWRTVYVVRPS